MRREPKDHERKSKSNSLHRKERADLLYYITKLCTKCNSNVLVIDNSVSEDFFTIFDNETGALVTTRPYLTVTKKVFITDNELSASKYDSFDFIFVYMGTNLMDMPFNPDECIIAPGYEPYEMKMIDVIRNNYNREIKNTLIIRDKADNKFSDKLVLDSLNLNEQTTMYSLDHDSAQYASYIALLYNKDVAKISLKKSATADMLEYLNDFGINYLGQDAKTMKKILA